MAIHPAFRTAKQGREHAESLVEQTRNIRATDGRLLSAVAARFGTGGFAKDCTAAYRRAFFDAILRRV